MTTNSSGQLDLNHWLIRLIAYIIDAIIIGIVAEIIAIIIGIAIILSGAFFLFVGFGLFFLTFGILSILRCLLGRNNRQKNYGITGTDGDWRQDNTREIIHSQHKQNLSAFPLSRLDNRSCNGWT